MSYSSQIPPDSSSNNTSSSSASQYATAALGVGLLVLGIVMTLWSTVPDGSSGNISQSTDQVRNTSSVGFVLLGTGVAMLLLSLFLGIQNKYRAQRPPNSSANTEQGLQRDSLPNEAAQYTVPSYDEVVGNPEYPISQFSPRLNSTTQLPAYDELVEMTQDEVEGSGPCSHKNRADNLNSTHILPPGPTQTPAPDSNWFQRGGRARAAHNRSLCPSSSPSLLHHSMKKIPQSSRQRHIDCVSANSYGRNCVL